MGFDFTVVAGDGFVYIICPLLISSGINSLIIKVQYLVGFPFPIDRLFGFRAKKKGCSRPVRAMTRTRQFCFRFRSAVVTIDELQLVRGVDVDDG